jgi:hypothetical protein
LLPEQVHILKSLQIIPDEAGLAVLKGAVLFGLQPKIVSRRISRLTYGIQSWPEWDADLHPVTKKVVLNGQKRCKDVFFIVCPGVCGGN